MKKNEQVLEALFISKSRYKCNRNGFMQLYAHAKIADESYAYKYGKKTIDYTYS